MAVIQIRVSTNGTILGQEDIPDAAIPAIRAAYGGSTNDQTAAAVLADIRVLIRTRAMEARVNASRATALTTVQLAENAARVDFDTNEWPEV